METKTKIKNIDKKNSLRTLLANTIRSINI